MYMHTPAGIKSPALKISCWRVLDVFVIFSWQLTVFNWNLNLDFLKSFFARQSGLGTHEGICVPIYIAYVSIIDDWWCNGRAVMHIMKSNASENMACAIETHLDRDQYVLHENTIK